MNRLLLITLSLLLITSCASSVKELDVDAIVERESKTLPARKKRIRDKVRREKSLGHDVITINRSEVPGW